MPPRPSFPAAITSRLPSLRSLQTTAPLPPPTSPLPPSTSSTSLPSSSSSSSSSVASSSALAHLPPILPSTASAVLPTNVTSAISLLKSNSTPSQGIYLLARLYSQTYLLHPRDILTLPTLKPTQPPGTRMKLTRILEVGCRDYAIRSPAADGKELRKQMDYDARSLPTIPNTVVSCEVTVLEHTRSPQEVMIKKKRRKGYKKTIRQKNGWTRLRVGDIILGDGEGVLKGEVTHGVPSE